MLVEICAANLLSAITAERAGAHRLELCSALDLGGLTPSPGFLREARRQVSLPIHVLIRPREGDFHYSDAEVAAMIEDIVFCRETGLEGVVIGALDAGGALDLPVIRALLDAAGPLDTTFHRAYDCSSRDPFELLEQLIDLGFHRLLTSGRAPTAMGGKDLIRKLVERASGRLAIMPGAGISSQNIGELAAATGAREFHLSARKKTPQVTDNLRGPENALPGLEAGWHASDAMEIKQVKSMLSAARRDAISG